MSSKLHCLNIALTRVCLDVKNVLYSELSLRSKKKKKETNNTCARNRVHTRTKVFYNGPSSSFDSEDTSHLQNDILGRGPAAQLACKLYSNHLHHQHLSPCPLIPSLYSLLSPCSYFKSIISLNELQLTAATSSCCFTSVFGCCLLALQRLRLISN